MELDGVVGAEDGGLAAEELRHRRERVVRALLVDQPGRLVNETPEGLDPDRHLGELHLGELIGPERGPEGGPLLDVLDARLEAGLREAEGLSGDHDPRRVEEVHELAEAVPLLPDQVGLGNPDVLQGDLRRVARADP